MAVVNELVTKFVFEGSLKPLKNFQEVLKTSIIGIAKYGAALAAVGAATAAWANSTLRGAESLVRLSEDTDISITKLQEMQLITAQNGASAESFESSILSLTSKIGDAATQGSEDFNRLGISIRDSEGNIKSTDTVLGELTGKFRTLSQEQQISFAEKLGIDNKVIGAFNKSDEALKKITERARKFGLVTEDQTKGLNDYFASIETLRFGFTAVSRQMALNFAPVLGKLSNNVTDFLADFGSVFGPILAEFVDGIGNLLGAVNDFINATIGWKPLLLGFGLALAIAFPIVPIIAGIALLLVAIEDILTAFKGGKSVIADFFTEFLGIDIVANMTAAFDVLSVVIDNLKCKFSAMISFFTDAAGTIGNVFKDISSFFGDDNDINVNANQGNIAQPLPIGASNDNRSTTQVMSNDIKIEIKTNDPEAAGLAVSNALNTQLEQASFRYGKGGR